MEPTRRRLSNFPISRLFPNMVTIGGLCCGLSSIRFAMAERWEMAVAFLLFAAIIDGMDGRIARFLNSTSTFGAQLDSLSDFVCFGVCPVVVLYMWKMHEVRGAGWAVVLFFAVCCALRLARFNTSLMEEKEEKWQQRFFTGIPAPSGAMLALLPLALTLQMGPGYVDKPIFILVYVAIIGGLMASRIPTFSAKKVHVRHDFVLPIMIAAGAFITFFIIEPWLTMSILSLIYLAMIPVSMRRFSQLKSGTDVAELQDDDE